MKGSTMYALKSIVFACAAPLFFFHGVATSHAHEIKFGHLLIVHPWSPQPPNAARTAAGYMKIENRGSEDDRLTGATAEICDHVTFHSMTMEGDVAKMTELKDGVVIPAGKTVVFRPKGMHLMLTGLNTQPMENSEFKGTLTFEKAGTVDIDYEVASPDAGMTH
jgi:periplasmic copper chaperone A